ncbi:Pentatricopeptide repeat-containing protein [Thalictrum thalictroides]|uniref:Pentatricopeptide repeat-containing protein n=1 Tax=Thalictrum thalictroides TaxID=46969 RepID=A0A7J6V5K8_THATH|nr:Pentatricopeptide repeat-containing protein [Thalictrum thalictroides]
MLNFSLVANNYTFPPLIKACSALVLPYSKMIGDLVHAHVIKFGFPEDAFVVTTLIELYSSVGGMGTARRLFDGIPKRDVVLWTAMIDGYGKMGDVDEARVLFDEMPKRNVISWSAMMAAYSRVSDFKEVLSLFREMQETGIRPNDSVLVSVLTACANLGALAQGLWVHSYVKHNNLESNTILATAITDMYAKCGCIEAALSVFEGIKSKDTGAWNAMISGVAMNSDARKSLELFNRMCMDDAQPNETTFIAILTACTHAGLVDEGLTLFDQMSALYKLKPLLEHYACVVDLLARAGKLEEAEKFIDARIGGFSKGDANVWGALLGACRTYGNVEVGNRVWRKLAGLGVADCGTYMVLYNMYKESGWDREANQALQKIREMGMKKKPGCSLIEVDGVVDEFMISTLSSIIGASNDANASGSSQDSQSTAVQPLVVLQPSVENDDNYISSDDSSEEMDKIAFIGSCAISCIRRGGSVIVPLGRIGIETWQEHCIMFAPHWNLQLGHVVHLHRRWCDDPNSLLVLEMPLKWGPLDPNHLLKALQEKGFNGSFQQEAGNVDMIHVYGPNKAFIEMHDMHTVIRADNESLASLLFEAVNSVLNGI